MTAATSEGDDETEAPPMLAVYRHDVHKLRGRSHAAACEEIAGKRVNEAVPCGADADAAMLSQPRGNPEQTVPAHESPFRLSLLTGEVVAERASVDAFRETVQNLVTIENPEAAHAAWLESDAAAMFNEAVHYPYTSLKYHVLLTAALLANYRAGAAFDELSLVIDDPVKSVVPHRTVLEIGPVSLRVTADPGDRAAASLGAAPTRSFADVWSQLPELPVNVDGERRWRVLDAQLRRVRSWSVALQFIEDYSRTVGVEGRNDDVGLEFQSNRRGA